MIDGNLNSYCDWCGKQDNEDGTQNRMYNLGKAKSLIIVEICSKECGEQISKHESELLLTRGSADQRIIGMHVILGHKTLVAKFAEYSNQPEYPDNDVGVGA